MASVYKSLGRRSAQDAFDSDDQDLSDSLTDHSSSTVQAASDQPASHSHISSLPIEIKNRVLLLTTRGVSHRHRHLLNDLHQLLPHTRKDTKLDTKSSNNYNATLNALADLHSCNYVCLFEARKHGQDLYIWLARAPNGPTIKFSVSNVHTMGELGFGGNCLKGGRGIVVFDKSFEDGFENGAEFKPLVREMLAGVFCVPARGVRGMKPFIDRIIGVFSLDGKIWIRVYEIREAEKRQKEAGEDATETSLVEIGPRFVLTPIFVLEGSFSGPVLFENKEFVSPNQLRAEARIRRAGKYARRRGEAEERVTKKGSLGLANTKKKTTELDNSVLFG